MFLQRKYVAAGVALVLMSISYLRAAEAVNMPKLCVLFFNHQAGTVTVKNLSSATAVLGESVLAWRNEPLALTRAAAFEQLFYCGEQIIAFCLQGLKGRAKGEKALYAYRLTPADTKLFVTIKESGEVEATVNGAEKGEYVMLPNMHSAEEWPFRTPSVVRNDEALISREDWLEMDEIGGGAASSREEGAETGERGDVPVSAEQAVAEESRPDLTVASSDTSNTVVVASGETVVVPPVQSKGWWAWLTGQ